MLGDGVSVPFVQVKSAALRAKSSSEVIVAVMLLAWEDGSTTTPARAVEVRVSRVRMADGDFMVVSCTGVEQVVYDAF
jgi:hypothetical protein